MADGTLMVRAARMGDAAAIARYNEMLAWETEHRKLDPTTIRKGVEAVVGDRAKGEYFVAEADGRVVGQCSVTYEWSDWRNGNIWWLQSVYVDAEWRGKGVFTRLFDEVKASAIADGAVALRLYVEEENGAAQSAYARRGMVRTGYRVFELEFEGARDEGSEGK